MEDLTLEALYQRLIDDEGRTNAETGNVDAVLDGSIDLFINEYLKWSNLQDKTETSIVIRDSIPSISDR